MRFLVMPLMAVSVLAACQPPQNAPVGGVGFDNYADYIARREAALNSGTGTAAPVVPPAGPATGAPTAADLAQAGISGASALPGAQPALPAAPAAPAVGAPMSAIQPQAVAPAPSHTGISDEQDFSAVSSRETIASDKARMEQNRAQYVEIQPEALPPRSGGTAGPELIEYALKAPNRLGEKVYARSRVSTSSFNRNCARYESPEAAQLAFLKAGGPQKDSKNLDPDGDGFACYWDPTPFQKARG